MPWSRSAACLNLCHTDPQRDAFARRGNAMRIDGVDAELLDAEGVREMYPFLDFNNARFPIKGGILQRRGGTVRHDAVAWGYARGADSRGVDIIQNCEVTGIKTVKGKVMGVETNRGFIGCKKLGLAAAGNSSEVAAMAGLKLPIESHVLQAFVSEGLKPYIDGVVTFGAGHFYVSQSDKGGLVFGGDIDGYNSYARRGNLPMVEHVIEAGVAMIPGLARVRVLRSWGGIMDMSMDGSPIIDKTSIEGLYLNAGWCYGGFKATPASGWCFAHTIANDAPHKLNAAYRLDRFRRGYMIDEKGQGAIAQFALMENFTYPMLIQTAPIAERGPVEEVLPSMAMLPFKGPHRTIPRRWISGSTMFICATIPKGRFDEYAHHSSGCRAWLVVTRDTQTHEIFNVVTARDYAKKRAAP